VSAIIAVVVVAGVALAATRAGKTNMLSIPANKALSQAGKQVIVSISKDASNKGNMAYSPNPVQVQLGTTVVWKNNDSTSHDITSGKGMSDSSKGKVFDSGPIAAGKTFSHKFDIAGTYDYFDTLHPTMVGAVVVK
jgi:plastocyanin